MPTGFAYLVAFHAVFYYKEGFLKMLNHRIVFTYSPTRLIKKTPETLFRAPVSFNTKYVSHFGYNLAVTTKYVQYLGMLNVDEMLIVHL